MIVHSNICFHCINLAEKRNFHGQQSSRRPREGFATRTWSGGFCTFEQSISDWLNNPLYVFFTLLEVFQPDLSRKLTSKTKFSVLRWLDATDFRGKSMAGSRFSEKTGGAAKTQDQAVTSLIFKPNQILDSGILLKIGATICELESTECIAFSNGCTLPNIDILSCKINSIHLIRYPAVEGGG